VQASQRADRRTFCGTSCRVAQVLWNNPLTICGIPAPPTPGIGSITVGSYSQGVDGFCAKVLTLCTKVLTQSLFGSIVSVKSLFGSIVSVR